MAEHSPAPLQNDPDRAADSLVPDAVGEFVTERPGGAFDPRTYRDAPSAPSPAPSPASGASDSPGGDLPEPGAGAPRASGPGEEADKLR